MPKNLKKLDPREARPQKNPKKKFSKNYEIKIVSEKASFGF